MDKTERRYYMVRAMKSTERDFAIFFNNSVVAVGWSKLDFSEYPVSETHRLREKVKNEYYCDDNIFPPYVSKKLNEVVMFHRMNDDDRIIVPYNSYIILGIVQSERIYDGSADDADLCNQRKVQFFKQSDGQLKTIPRDDLSEGLQRRLRVRGRTISDLEEFRGEIDTLFSVEEIPAWELQQHELRERIINEQKNGLLKILQGGNTHLRAGGEGLEELVKELFECEGYNAEKLAKNRFPQGADADVLAVRSDRFHESKVLVQVKHHSGYTGEEGLKQLEAIRKLDEYDGEKLVLITSGGISEEVKDYATERDIAVFDGEKLVDWIFDNLEKLKADTKRRLCIDNLPRVLSI